MYIQSWLCRSAGMENIKEFHFLSHLKLNSTSATALASWLLALSSYSALSGVNNQQKEATTHLLWSWHQALMAAVWLWISVITTLLCECFFSPFFLFFFATHAIYRASFLRFMSFSCLQKQHSFFFLAVPILHLWSENEILGAERKSYFFSLNANSLPTLSTNWSAGQVFSFYFPFLYFHESLASDSGPCNCDQRSRKWSKLQLLTATGLTLG